MDWRQGEILSFFFQAEDGIRDYDVTGVQTCALPILRFSEGIGGHRRIAFGVIWVSAHPTKFI